MNLKYILNDYKRLKAAVEANTSILSGGSGGGSLAAVAFSGDYNDLINTPVLAAVATSGDYNDLSNLPTIPSFDTVDSYVSSFEADLYIYSGFNLNGTPIIKRYLAGVETFAVGVTDLATDWPNRLSLTYI